MTDIANRPANFTFDRLLDLLADRLAVKLGEDARSLLPRLLTISQVVAYLGLDRTIVEHLIAQHRLPTVRIDKLTLLDRHDIDQWIQENKAGWADLSRPSKKALE